MRGRLSERVAIVTGGAGGIGSTVARALSGEGASVVDGGILAGADSGILAEADGGILAGSDGGILAEASAVLTPDV
ncbi:hypothetical protein SAMN06272771_1011 [Streptomyces sp. Ag82_O1-12]|uniref:hypothetical protein n=1 Tax=unclassified Streptomyces TaxID=2593676 RepID=UPI000BD648F3|nr:MULTISPECIES: hypothetical protein [unclassified Streptomyces]SMQ14704.1 hypothetical protein SAMN06272771_1011 [Streptomyces sp. Ag82_O1-12]SOD43730.1 hypothetical protein SAMN06272727_1002 [Streptomyces sp. Ag82_G6-1]